VIGDRERLRWMGFARRDPSFGPGRDLNVGRDDDGFRYAKPILRACFLHDTFEPKQPQHQDGFQLSLE